MPTPAKNAANMAKHMTQAERDRRAEAEASVLKVRGKPHQCGKLISGDSQAKKYWDQIWRDMEELEILDVLDAHALRGLCSLLSQRDRLARITPVLLERMDQLAEGDLSDEEMTTLASIAKSAASLSDKRLKVDTQILQYCDKLGLTPSGRARLAARKAAEAAAEEDDDLFG